MRKDRLHTKSFILAGLFLLARSVLCLGHTQRGISDLFYKPPAKTNGLGELWIEYTMEGTRFSQLDSHLVPIPKETKGRSPRCWMH